jgi:hypothetical protein
MPTTPKGILLNTIRAWPNVRTLERGGGGSPFSRTPLLGATRNSGGVITETGDQNEPHEDLRQRTERLRWQQFSVEKTDIRLIPDPANPGSPFIDDTKGFDLIHPYAKVANSRMRVLRFVICNAIFEFSGGFPIGYVERGANLSVGRVRGFTTPTFLPYAVLPPADFNPGVNEIDTEIDFNSDASEPNIFFSPAHVMFRIVPKSVDPDFRVSVAQSNKTTSYFYARVDFELYTV